VIAVRVLVSTRRTQGQGAGDFCFAVDGELVRTEPECRKDRGDPDGPCGCGRSFIGMSSGLSTTTAEVADLEMSRDDYVAALTVSRREAGWGSGDAPDEDDAGYAETLLEITGEYPAGTVLVRRLDDLYPRG
jgi:hypothetical protein